MRNIRLICGILAFSVFSTFTSCQKDDAFAPDKDATEFAKAEYQLTDLKVLEKPEVTIASEAQTFGVHDDKKCQDTHSLDFILRNLSLNETQRKAVKEFVKGHASCVSEHQSKVKERHQELVKHANAGREEYVKAYKAGKITKAQLEEKLTAMREKLKGQLQNDEHKQMRLRILQKCRTDLMAKIASVLNREQLQKFNRWRENLK